jgi:hypothetical protein
MLKIRPLFALVLAHCAVATLAAPAVAPQPIKHQGVDLQIKRGLAFLAGLYDTNLSLLPEYRGSQVYWLYHDNYLASKLLAPTRPELAQKIRSAIASFGCTNSGKIEILFDEAHNPLPFRQFLLTNVAELSGKQIRTERVLQLQLLGWEQYADLRLLAALALRQTNSAEARRHLQAASAMWDGRGFADPAKSHHRLYSTYKLALFLLAEARLHSPSSLHAVVLERLLTQQDREGGFVTDYQEGGSPAGVANVETTCLALLALREL